LAAERLTVMAPAEHNEPGHWIVCYRRLLDCDAMLVRSGRTRPFGASGAVADVPWGHALLKRNGLAARRFAAST
jgi:hypothetical protein